MNLPTQSENCLVPYVETESAIVGVTNASASDKACARQRREVRRAVEQDDVVERQERARRPRGSIRQRIRQCRRRAALSNTILLRGSARAGAAGDAQGRLEIQPLPLVLLLSEAEFFERRRR